MNYGFTIDTPTLWLGEVYVFSANREYTLVVVPYVDEDWTDTAFYLCEKVPTAYGTAMTWAKPRSITGDDTSFLHEWAAPRRYRHGKNMTWNFLGLEDLVRKVREYSWIYRTCRMEAHEQDVDVQYSRTYQGAQKRFWKLVDRIGVDGSGWYETPSIDPVPLLD